MSVPESKTPVSDVAVCARAPEFVQHTVVPLGTVTAAGSKKLSRTSITVEPAGQPAGGSQSQSKALTIMRANWPDHCASGPRFALIATTSPLKATRGRKSVQAAT
jgi:hypothetical protein